MLTAIQQLLMSSYTWWGQCSGFSRRCPVITCITLLLYTGDKCCGIQLDIHRIDFDLFCYLLITEARVGLLCSSPQFPQKDTWNVLVSRVVHITFQLVERQYLPKDQMSDLILGWYPLRISGAAHRMGTQLDDVVRSLVNRGSEKSASLIMFLSPTRQLRAAYTVE